VETSINQRLRILPEALGFTSIRQFGIALGYQNPEKLHRIIRDEDTKPSYDILSDVLRLFPRINAEWLITGHGPMFKPSDSYSPAGDRIARICEEYDLTVEALADRIHQNPTLLHEMINNPKMQMGKELFVSILQEFSAISPNWLQFNEGKMIRNNEPVSNKFVFEVNETGAVELIISVRKKDAL